MAEYYSLRCAKGESATARVERAKAEGMLSADAYKGPIKKDRFGSKVAPVHVDVVGDVTEHSGQTMYYICQPKLT